MNNKLKLAVAWTCGSAFLVTAVSIYVLALNWLLTVKAWVIITWLCVAATSILWLRVRILRQVPAEDSYAQFAALSQWKWLVVAILWMCLLKTLDQEQIDWLDSHSFITGPQPRFVTLDMRSDNLRAFIFYTSIWLVTLILSVVELSHGAKIQNFTAGTSGAGQQSVSAPTLPSQGSQVALGGPAAVPSDYPVVVVVQNPSAPSYDAQIVP